MISPDGEGTDCFGRVNELGAVKELSAVSAIPLHYLRCKVLHTVLCYKIKC